MPKFEDCESCAFYGEEPAICEQCEDADQWEPSDEGDWEDMIRARGYYTQVIRINKAAARRLKKQAAQQPDIPIYPLKKAA